MSEQSEPTSQAASDPGPADYRLAPAVAARLVGGLLIVVALLLVVATVVVAVLRLPLVTLLLIVVAGALAALITGYLLTSRLSVVHLGPEGYRVRLIRGAGVTEATWPEVDEAVAATSQGVPVVVLKLGDGRTTTIPVTVLAVDRDQFVRDLQGYLQRGHGLRRFS